MSKPFYEKSTIWGSKEEQEDYRREAKEILKESSDTPSPSEEEIKECARSLREYRYRTSK